MTGSGFGLEMARCARDVALSWFPIQCLLLSVVCLASCLLPPLCLAFPFTLLALTLASRRSLALVPHAHLGVAPVHRPARMTRMKSTSRQLAVREGTATEFEMRNWRKFKVADWSMVSP